MFLKKGFGIVVQEPQKITKGRLLFGVFFSELSYKCAIARNKARTVKYKLTIARNKVRIAQYKLAILRKKRLNCEI